MLSFQDRILLLKYKPKANIINIITPVTKIYSRLYGKNKYANKSIPIRRAETIAISVISSLILPHL
ncbi:hypothetical protein DRO97_03250 [Archaeoglobales archaeon]|nr:MAG: hypothetical protein DRO97_03250 [Archaeoglobales archaeon]